MAIRIPFVAIPQLAQRHALGLAHHAARSAGRGFGGDVAGAQVPREALPPGIEVGLARIEPHTARPQRANGQVNVGVAGVGVQGEHIVVALGERLGREGPRCITHASRRRACGHREHD